LSCVIGNVHLYTFPVVDHIGGSICLHQCLTATFSYHAVFSAHLTV